MDAGRFIDGWRPRGSLFPRMPEDPPPPRPRAPGTRGRTIAVGGETRSGERWDAADDTRKGDGGRRCEWAVCFGVQVGGCRKTRPRRDQEVREREDAQSRSGARRAAARDRTRQVTRGRGLPDDVRLGLSVPAVTPEHDWGGGRLGVVVGLGRLVVGRLSGRVLLVRAVLP